MSERLLTDDGVRPAPPRILRVTVRASNGKLGRSFTKVPYGGIYAMTEMLSRAIMTNEIEWFRIERAKAKDITPGVRSSLERWPVVLLRLGKKLGVSWQT